MAKFVIAGSAACPYFAKAELLADYLQKNLPDFRIHKITQRPDVWEKWLKELCRKNKWSHKRSPIIWRELLDRGGKGLLLGGFNEFLEHAQLYYGVTSKMMTQEMLLISGENLETHIEIEQEERELKKEINPLKVWITGASCPTCYNLIPLLVNGEVFSMDKEISIHLLNNDFKGDTLSTLVMEGQDLAAPLLREISVCTVKEEAFFEAEVIIILNDNIEDESESLEDRIKARLPLCQLFGSLIEKNAHKTVKVIIAGKTFLNLTTSLLIMHTPSINPRNIIAVAMVIENEAKAMLARKLKTTTSDIKDVIIWGNITGSRYIDLKKAKVFRYDSAIWGPPSYSRYLLNLIFDSEWITKEFGNSLNQWSLIGHFQRGISSAHCIATTLKFWYHDSPPGEIFSLGIMSEGEFGTPEGMVFSMPAKCVNGVWFPQTDLPDTELTEDIKGAIAHDLEQEKLIALGEVLSYQPYVPEFFSAGSLEVSDAHSSQEPLEGAENESPDN
ncbi:putative malate dehydrogenase 1B [Trichosurus vulpecula]|uniref:putative malate dehydrogenase 1B n=1 Tax=Trichosurus vulpecula TaxID=9337 RepID=UPI00186B5815|nr:putative malate dehydrogenase 1B [Trichosurus vulpecula]